MFVDIDYPLPGCVSAVFTVGGTYDGTGRGGNVTVTVTLSNSAGVAIASAPPVSTSPLPPVEGSWSVTYTDTAPPHSDCILTAQLFDSAGKVGNPDEVDGINTTPANNGGGINIHTTP